MSIIAHIEQFLGHRTAQPLFVPTNGKTEYAPLDGQARMDAPRLNPQGRQITPVKPHRKTLTPPSPTAGQN